MFAKNRKPNPIFWPWNLLTHSWPNYFLLRILLQFDYFSLILVPTTPWSPSIIHSSSTYNPLIRSTNHGLHINCSIVKNLPCLDDINTFTEFCLLATWHMSTSNSTFKLFIFGQFTLDQPTNYLTITNPAFYFSFGGILNWSTLLLTFLMHIFIKWESSTSCTLSILLVDIHTGKHLDEYMSSPLNWLHLQSPPLSSIYNCSTLPSSSSAQTISQPICQSDKAITLHLSWLLIMPCMLV